MISYELAKALKDNGFEYTSHSFDACASRCLFEDDEFIHFPDLSELIEACGDDLSHIKKYNGYWWAVSHSKFDENGNNFEEEDVDITVAVAKLWLAINKK
jgi:hypothetical protein